MSILFPCTIRAMLMMSVRSAIFSSPSSVSLMFHSHCFNYMPSFLGIVNFEMLLRVIEKLLELIILSRNLNFI